jgi:hypothetical protein
MERAGGSLNEGKTLKLTNFDPTRIFPQRADSSSPQGLLAAGWWKGPRS